MARALIIPRLGAAAAPAGFPYNHRTLAETDASDPARWREVNAEHFDALHGPEERNFEIDGSSHASTRDFAERIANARQWRIDNKPYFDAIFGPETVCTCGAA